MQIKTTYSKPEIRTVGFDQNFSLILESIQKEPQTEPNW